MKPSEIIREYGWYQGGLTGNYYHGTLRTPLAECGGFSMLGAVVRSAYDKSDGNTVETNRRATASKTKLKEVLPHYPDTPPPPGWGSDPNRISGKWISDWNDAPNRTKEEVIDKLEEAGL